MQNVAILFICIGLILAIMPFAQAVGAPIIRGGPSDEVMFWWGGVLFAAGVVDLVFALAGWGGYPAVSTLAAGGAGFLCIVVSWICMLGDPFGRLAPWTEYPGLFGVGVALIGAAVISAVFG